MTCENDDHRLYEAVLAENLNLREPVYLDPDPVNHPEHYTSNKSGIECIQIAEHMNFCLGNAIKYIWRASLKNGVEDLKKAEWYIKREIERLGRSND